jgi:hypothetical protein
VEKIEEQTTEQVKGYYEIEGKYSCLAKELVVKDVTYYICSHL